MEDQERENGKVKLEHSRREQAVEAFLGGCNCAQAVFSTYADLFGIDRQTAMNLTNSMGGGISRLREVCGTVSAVALLTGLAEGNVDPGDLQARERVYQRTRDLLAKFEAENGSLICRELLGILGRDQSARPSERTPEYYRKRPCAKFVACAAAIIEENLTEEGACAIR
jgi:C_GCAxxG_C_C family probable redox protein